MDRTVQFGYTLSSEEHPPRDLVDLAARAEEAGFDFASISDHYHPWTQEQGHSPFVWAVLGAIANRTRHIEVGVGVCCPIIRIHPAVIAQASATTALLFGDRFFFGVGTGEALNEHILGDRWPTVEQRQEMLREALEVIRELWTGETVDFAGEYYTVENARLFDPPTVAPAIVVSGFGEKAVTLAAEVGDGYWGHAPDADTIKLYEAAGGEGHRYAQIDVCFADDVESARKTAATYWATAGVPGQLHQDLPTWTHFEQAAALVTEDKVAEAIMCGPDPGPVVEAVRKHIDAGFDRVYLHQVGPDQDGFFQFWKDSLQPALQQART